MWKDLAYSKRALYLAIGLLVVLISGYQLAIGNTIELYQENSRLEGLNQTDQSVLAARIVSQSERKEMIDSLLNQVNLNESRSEMINGLFRTADRFSLGVVGANESTDNEGGELYTFRFSGRYVNMVRFLRSVESSLSSGKLESVEVKKETDRRTKEEHLLLAIIIRRLDHDA